MLVVYIIQRLMIQGWFLKPLIWFRNHVCFILQQVHWFLPTSKVKLCLSHHLAFLTLGKSLHPEPSEGGNSRPSTNHDDWPGWIIRKTKVALVGILDGSQNLCLHHWWLQHSRRQTLLVPPRLCLIIEDSNNQADISVMNLWMHQLWSRGLGTWCNAVLPWLDNSQLACQSWWIDVDWNKLL